MEQALLEMCNEEAERMGRSGAPQLAGFVLRKGTEQRPRAWEGLATERTLLGYAVDRALAAQRARETSRAALSRLPLWRESERVSRLEDLASDLQSGKRNATVFHGLRPSKGGRPIQARHVQAATRTLQKSAQRRNMSRLFAHAERLDALVSTSEGAAALDRLDDALSERWGAGALMRWVLCSRFVPIRFQGRVLTTKLVVSSLYLGEREQCDYAGVDKHDARLMRIDMLLALRELDQVMGWGTIRTSFPERLVMTQGDLKQKRSDDDDKGDGLRGAIRDLAARTTSQEGDERLWDAMREEPALHRLYARTRAALEAELEADVLVDEPASARPARWLIEPRYALGAFALLIVMIGAFALGPIDERAAVDLEPKPGARTISASLSRLNSEVLSGVDAVTTSVSMTWSSIFAESTSSQLTPPDQREDEVDHEPPTPPTPPTPPKKPDKKAPAPKVLAVEEGAPRAVASSVRAYIIAGKLTIIGEGRSDMAYSYDVVRGNPTRCKVQGSWEGKQLTLEQITGRRRSRCSVDVTLRVPRTSSVFAEIRSGRLSAEGLSGDQELEVVSGSMVLRAMRSEDLRVSIGSGSFDFEGSVIRGDVGIRSGSAKMRVSALPERGELEIDSKNGDVTLWLPRSAKFNASLMTLMGEITNAFEPDASSQFLIDVSANMGHIELKRSR